MELSVSEDKRLCRCGCGTIVTGKTGRWKDGGYKTKEYVWGHNRRNTKQPNYIPKRAADHGKWKGGRMLNTHGYILVRSPTHPKAYKHGLYVFEHILVMEKYIGRYLTKEEVVHHKDGNRQNNAIDNLQLLTRGAHTSLHLHS